MNQILQRITSHALQRPTQPAVLDHGGSLTYRELDSEIRRLAGLLRSRRVAWLMGNSCAWAVLDLAVQSNSAVGIPIPPFFSDAQLEHVLGDARPDLVVTDQPQRLIGLLHMSPAVELWVAGRRLSWFRLAAADTAPLPGDTAKLTYTSGTTGRPKGVCLGAAALAQVTMSLSQAVQATPDDRSLALLPLSTLLENIGGVYAPLYSGAQACLPDLTDCGLRGSSGADPAQVIAALDHFRPTSTILVPQLLKVMVEAAQHGAPVPGSLRFAAVGGAHTAPALIERARRLSLPVYEGYGLSEACSVVSLNLPDRDHVGSAGRVLPHARVRIAEDGEVVVGGTLFTGYLGRPGPAAGEWRTGDLGRLDADGYLHITGRKRSAYVTAYGRNVSPDWVEGELLATSAVMQAAVFGEGRPYNVAVLVPHPRATTGAIFRAMAETNRRLPDYARVPRWIIANDVFTPANGLSRGSGSVNRSAVANTYAAEIENLYAREETDVLV